jgi:hypothetical protein
VPTSNQPILDKSLRDRRKHLPDDFAVLLPERRGITPYANNLLIGLHKQKYTYRAIDGQTGAQSWLAADRPGDKLCLGACN